MRTGIQKRIWLHICREGGTWTPDEIAERFEMGRQRASVLLQNMATRSESLRRFKVGGRTSFGVTSDCRIPDGVTMGEVRELNAPTASQGQQ